MKIRNKLYISVGIVITLIVILVSAILVISDKVTEKNTEQMLAHNLHQNISELNIVTYEYLLHREERMEQQWHLKYGSLASFIKEEETRLMGLVYDNYIVLNNFFSNVIANNERKQRLIQEAASQERIDIVLLLEDRLVAQLLIKSHSIITDAAMLAEMARIEAVNAQEFANNLTLFLVIILAITLLITFFFVAKSILKPLNELIKGTNVIGKGHLDHKIEVKTRDEMGQLAVSFNRMTENLKKSNSVLKDSEQRLNYALDASSDGIWDWNVITGEVKFSNCWCESLGYAPEEVEGHVSFWENIIHPDDKKHTLKTLDDHFQGKTQIYEVENRLRMQSGAYRYNLDIGKVVEWDNEGNPIRMIGTDKDITERKRLEEVLRFTQFAVDNNADATYWVKSDAKISYANKAACQSLGYSYEELTCMRVPDIDPDFPDESWPAHWQEMKEAGTLTFEAHHKTKAGLVFHVEIQSTYLEYDGQEYICAFVRNITKRKKAEEQIKVSLQEKEILLAEIHHRVRNNMQVISSMLSLQSRLTKDNKLTEILDDSQNRIQSMALVHEKLYQSKDFTKITLQDYINELAGRLIGSYSERTGTVTMNVEADGIQFNIDTIIPIGLIINELITNSMKHAFHERKGNEIKVALKRTEVEGEFELIVSDNGIGIPEDIDIKNTKTLGLSLIMSLAERQLNGKLKINNDNGAEFRIMFKEIKKSR